MQVYSAVFAVLLPCAQTSTALGSALARLFCPGLQNPENFLAFRYSERSDWKSTSNFRFASFIASLKPAVLADLSARVQVRIHDYY